MSSDYLIGLDVGGGGGRALLVEVGTGRSQRAARAWTHRPAPDTGGMGSDLDLEGIWRALAEATREVIERSGIDPARVAGLAVTGLRYGLVVLDGRGAPVYAGPNRDARAVAEALRMAAEHGTELQQRSGHWPVPILAAPRLVWFAKHHADALRSGARALSVSDWVNYRLSGEIAADLSQAGETGLLDLGQRAWARDWIEKLGLPPELFPALVPSGTLLGPLGDAAATEFGLRPGTPVVVGGADTQCALLGTGTVATGDCAAVVGTTAPVEVVTEAPIADASGRFWSGIHVVPDRYVIESNAGPMGEALEWLGRLLHPDAPQPAGRLLAEAELSPTGAAGVVSTFGAEIGNARDMNLPVGTLTLSHLAADALDAREHLARAVVEGMAYALRANRDQILEATLSEPAPLRLAGGVSRSPLFAQIVADVFDEPVAAGGTGDESALGAAICAGVGAGLYEGLTDGARALVPTGRVYTPEPATAATYASAYANWRKLRDSRREGESEARNGLTAATLRNLDTSAEAGSAQHRPRILVTADLDQASLAALRELGEVEYASFRESMQLLTGPSLVRALRDVEVLVTEIDVVDAAALGEIPSLRVIAACRGDAVNVDVDACTALGIPVLHAPGRNAVAVADLAVAFMLMLCRKLPEASRFLHQPGIEAGDMGRMGQAFSSLRGRELGGKTVGLIGMGAVGVLVAARLRGFGVRVLVHDPYVPHERVVRAGAEPVALETLLEESDFVSLHAAVTEETRGLLGEAEFARMKPGACLVNTARAALVDEDALFGALQSGTLAGAALDVFSVEPPGSDHPLLAIESVIATPHVAGNTFEIGGHQGRIVAQDLARMLRGEAPHHALNPDLAASFDWSRPRPEVEPGVLETLAQRPGPAVSDLQRGAPETPKPATADAPAAPTEVVEAVARILGGFTARINADPALREFAGDQQVTLHFTLADLGLEFYLALDSGSVEAAVGAPAETANVRLRMTADILDGMFTGRVNAMQKAMSGELSFTGDTAKAMTLQHIQRDLERLYREAREEAGDPGDLSAIASDAAAAGSTPTALAAGDVRTELVAIVEELYAGELITATGGNVSVLIPNSDELWITPSQLFKGDLDPGSLVRIDREGQPLDPAARAPSSERLMHCAAYRARPEARAVIHAHAAHATILANTGLPFLPISTEAAFFGELPRIPFIMPGTDALAAAVEEALRESWAVLMQNHGLLIAGRSLRRAADMAEIIERTAQVILGCYAVGKEPPTLPEETVAELRKMGDLVA
ncbi:MAG: class II aldolase/adducin family protein [Myxococcales bacterium]|nr:class II aldolase/adducin family protein [Myxococcales bacterium]